ncbi:hypothetical protein [Methylobacterium brachiatum]|uniref:hypothetical protein n=1 Tax=Methylobacterium brachiatum TaxID=269660 RepID=UPI0008F0295C|nr:hypothetical protein [Methylobacterium brachiatum]SFH98159.1 hypothetical protein SAMN02799642_00349 [Methylobacterium brachiatum]
MFVPEHIHIGKGGNLFLVQGANNVLSQYVDTPVVRWLLWQWRQAILTRHKRLQAMGICYKHVTIPEKLTIYDHVLDGIDLKWVLSPAVRLYHEDPYYRRFPLRAVNVRRYLQRRKLWRSILIDLVAPMRRRRDDLELYFQTDTHWTFDGRMIGYHEICRALGAQPVRDFRRRPTQYAANWSGDLGAVCIPPWTEGATFSVLQRDAERIYASPIVEHRERSGQIGTLHTGSHTVYRNDKSQDPRRLVLFGDSYAHFAPIMLTIMLAETFREVHFIWSTQVDFGYIERVKPDIVLTEMSERFIYRAPDDAWDLEAYARDRYGDELSAPGPTDQMPGSSPIGDSASAAHQSP